MCGIFAAFDARKAAELTYLGLHAQQARADEYAGMVTFDGTLYYRHARPGIVTTVFTNEILSRLHGKMALGHIRYSTVEDKDDLDNAQPIVARYRNGFVALAHNGNITNVTELKRELGEKQTYQTSMDTEVILQLFLKAQGSINNRIQKVCAKLRGSYSLVFLFPELLVVVRDPDGNRPLALGRKNNSYFIASETCAFRNIQAEHVRDIEPGEILNISRHGLRSHFILRDGQTQPRQCIFELIYYATPSSKVFGKSVSEFRYQLGELLYEHCTVPDADLVMPVPDSSNVIALGYSQRSSRKDNAIDFEYALQIGWGGPQFATPKRKRDIPMLFGLFRNHYTSRTFIAPNQHLRFTKASRKFLVDEWAIGGKRIILVDDSIVRLTTLPIVVSLLKSAGAREIHVRIACPPIISPCHYGIDTPSKNELAAALMTREEMRVKMGADSLEYLPRSALRSAAHTPTHFCYACMTGEYPIAMEPLQA